MLIISIILQSLLALVFLMTGFMKISGNKQQVETFKHLNLPQWFRVVTGLVQLVGAAGLVIGFWNHGVTALAGSWLAITMLGGVMTHIRAKDSITQAIPAFILAILATIITIVNLSDMLNLFS
ncbi:DoxX family protein [Lysinibacillus xylanilyticus]|uniref:DoxX family protein n=1 Tax=Lysinibacillus xylanilyticus TaxID=582475 RepID=UPI003D08B279